MIVPNQHNIKVHFAGAEVTTNTFVLKCLGINYFLYTAFAFLERKVLKTKRAPVFLGHLEDQKQIPQYVCNGAKHVIQDSGLFTLMFGSHKGKKDERLIEAWYNALVEFTLENNNNATVVEVDCQKILGVEKAWQLRERMKNELPNRQINVFHKEDGQKGLDRLIEFSDYIAVSVPELRVLGQKNHTEKIVHYIKNKKPSIDIHLLGCTENKLLKQLSFCTSADSTSHKAPVRFGFIKGRHVKNIRTKEVVELFGEKNYNFIRQYYSEAYANTEVLSGFLYLQKYTQYGGTQD